METAFVRSGPVQNYPALVSGVSLILMTIIASISYLNQTLEPFFAVVLLDFIVSASIYFCFKDESPRLAMWSSALRAIYSIFLLVIVGINLGDWQSFDRSFTLILGFFGFHLGVQAWIFLRLKTLRYLMAFLLFISGLGYIFDSLLMAFQWTGVSPVAEYTFVGEIVMTFWFLFIAFKREFPLK
tara:strand:- start:406 stop:957 length:552 start_codon:yes stop_codon:yes gene_type:complete